MGFKRTGAAARSRKRSRKAAKKELIAWKKRRKKQPYLYFQKRIK